MMFVPMVTPSPPEMKPFAIDHATLSLYWADYIKPRKHV